MNEEQADKLIAAVEALTKLIERVSRPPVIVTPDAGCEMVVNYQRRGYPIYFIPDESAEREAREQEFTRMMCKDIAPA